MPKAKSLKDQVCDYISDKISCGEWAAGQKINEVEICNELEISRTPVREALIKLASENQIDWISRRGFQVRQFSEAEQQNQYIVSSVLDVLSAVLALDYLNEQDYQKMEDTIQDGRDSICARDYSRYVVSSEEFHKCYYLKCNNPTLINMIVSLRHSFLVPAYQNDNQDKLFETLSKLNEQHAEMIVLFKKKDANTLEKYMREVHWLTRYDKY